MPFDGSQSSNPMTTILQKVRGFIEEGWCQNHLRNGSQVCVRGAIFKALTGDPELGSKLVEAYKVEGVISKANGITSVVAWNNGHTQSKAGILNGLDRAIEYSRTLVVQG